MPETFPISFGRYELSERLAIGGMAELFRARAVDDEPPGDLAIKRLLPHLATEPYYREMFLDEAKLTARLSHPNIIHAHDYGVHDGHLFIAMELVDGLDGLSILRECAHRKVRMPLEVAVSGTHQVLCALAFAHSQVDGDGEPLGVVHRDISPANVLFSRAGEVKLADFGIAHAAQHQHRTKDGTLKGKYGYMSPEQINGTDVDARSDVFSAGVLLAEMLIGRRLFAAASDLDVLLMVRDVNLHRLEKYGSHVGVDLDRILRKALKKNPDDRFDSSAAFKEALSEWMHLHHQVMSVADIRVLVNMLYDDAWTRKRERTAKLAEEFSASEQELSSPTLKPDSKTDLKPDSKTDLSETGGPPSNTASGQLNPDDRRASRASARPTPPPLPPRVSARRSPPAASTAPSVPSADPETSSSTGSRTVSIGRIALSSRSARAGSQRPTPHSDTRGSARNAPQENDQPREMFDSDATDSRWSPSIDFDDRLVSEVLNRHHIDESAIADVEAVGAAQIPVLGQTDTPPDESGNFTDAAPIRVFFRLAVSNATGLLVAKVGGVCKEIYVRNGLPEYVASNVASELFGQYLVNQGVISPGELSMALAMMPHYGEKLGETLVGLGLLQPLDVFRYLSNQLRDKLTDLYTWSKGTYDWYDGKQNPRTAFPLALNAFEMLGASIRALPEHVLTRWAEDANERRPRAVSQPPVPLEVFGLGRALDLVWRELDGTRSVSELLEQHRDKGDQTTWLRIMYLLAHTEQVIL